jgi:hypothetical protein
MTSVFSGYLYITTAGVRCSVASVKVASHFTSVLLYFSGPSRLLIPADLAVVRDVAPFQNPYCTDSIKPSLQFSSSFAVYIDSDGSFLSRY